MKYDECENAECQIVWFVKDATGQVATVSERWDEGESNVA